MYTRLKDIAVKTGFSINTVSLALSGSARISENTKNRIAEVAKELNYIHNDVARSLVKKETKTIGLILAEITNPILTKNAQQIEAILDNEGYSMIIMATNNNKFDEVKALDLLIARHVDGILMYPILPHNLTKIAELRARNFPIVLLGFGDYDSKVDAVYIDRALGAFKATSHLAKLGHKEIAYIHGEEEKYKGYMRALEENNCQYNSELVIKSKGVGYEKGYNAAAQLFENQRPTAIFAARDYLALGAMKWCINNGLRVPEDVAIIGFDDVEASKFAQIPLSTITYPVDNLTVKATELLIKNISNKKTLNASEPTKIMIEPTLVIRDSCGFKDNYNK